MKPQKSHINTVTRKIDKRSRSRLNKSIDASKRFSPKNGSRTSNNREASLNKIVLSKFNFYEPNKFLPYNFSSNRMITTIPRESSLSKSSLESLRQSDGSSRKKSASKKQGTNKKKKSLTKNHAQTISVSFDKRSSTTRHARNKTATYKTKNSSITNFQAMVMTLRA